MSNHARWTGDLWVSLSPRTRTNTQALSAIPILQVIYVVLCSNMPDHWKKLMRTRVPSKGKLRNSCQIRTFQ